MSATRDNTDPTGPGAQQIRLHTDRQVSLQRTAGHHGGGQLLEPLAAALVLVAAPVAAADGVPRQVVQHHAPIHRGVSRALC